MTARVRFTKTYTGTRSIKTAPNTVYRTKPLWSWNFVIVHDVQTGRISLPELVKSIPGGYETHYDDPNDYDRYLTKSAIRRLGA